MRKRARAQGRGKEQGNAADVCGGLGSFIIKGEGLSFQLNLPALPTSSSSKRCFWMSEGVSTTLTHTLSHSHHIYNIHLHKQGHSSHQATCKSPQIINGITLGEKLQRHIDGADNGKKFLSSDLPDTHFISSTSCLVFTPMSRQIDMPKKQ